MKRLIVIILSGVVLALIFRKYCFEVIYVASSSMEPTYRVKKELVINKMSYFFLKPSRNDVVLLKSPFRGREVIKRIIGLPGEIISIEDKDVYINDELLEEDYVQYVHPDTIFVGDNIEEFTIPNNHYFVMGDNRDVSRDSRDWLEDEGMQTEPVPAADIKGKVLSFN